MIASSPDGVVIDVRVIPRAAKAGVAGTREDAVLVRLHAPPVDGAANAELIDILSHALGVPRRAIAIAAGERTRRKRVAVAGITADEARRRLAP
jgi:hypothetical protein